MMPATALSRSTGVGQYSAPLAERLAALARPAAAPIAPTERKTLL
ncbi:hypothetical protein [Nocardia harenae]|nr:hypothetical protein [Nocardia harenae]